MEIYGNLRHAAVDDLVECVILLYGFATEELFSSKRFFPVSATTDSLPSLWKMP